MEVLYTAAHAVSDSESAPVGGGGAICRWLRNEWQAKRPFRLRVLGPELMGKKGPGGAELTRYSERRYARFCVEFEAAVTEEVLKRKPHERLVLANDISEGPDFRRVAEAGFPIATIFHVDVVEYVCSLYLRGLVRPETSVRWFERLRHWKLPRMARLIWEKQREAVRYSKVLIVPSKGMKEVIGRCYPEEAGKVVVLPWGAPPVAEAADTKAAIEQIRAWHQIPKDASIVMTLSRISPEKGQDRLLQALGKWERDGLDRELFVFVCGAPAYMQGQRFLQKLQAEAKKLQKVHVVFPGHVTGVQKQALLEMADVFVCASRHESYGLTLMEALQAGKPAVCLPSHGTAEILREEFGTMAEEENLRDRLALLLWDAEARERMGRAGREYAAERPFEETAGKLAEILRAAVT